MYLVLYDIKTKSRSDRRRLRNTGRICENYGIRIQKSVFLVETISALNSLNKELAKLELQEKELLVMAVRELSHSPLEFSERLLF